MISLSRTKKGPFFEEAVEVRGYPLETIFAEKLESICRRRETNSRMKDYHDLFMMIQNQHLLDKNRLQASIRKTFESRKTRLSIPLGFTSNEIQKVPGTFSD